VGTSQPLIVGLVLEGLALWRYLGGPWEPLGVFCAE
jgi:hypothetical protein